MFIDYSTSAQQLMTQNRKSDLHMHLTAQIASFILGEDRWTSFSM